LLLAALIALTGSPLLLVEDDVLKLIINAFLQLGRDHPHLAVGTREVTLSRYRTRMAMIEAGQRICNDRIALFACRPAISIAIDAGTIEGRHFLDIMLLAPSTGLRSF
jgi:hypothetical protein